MRIEIAGPDGPARKSNFSRLWTQRRLMRFSMSSSRSRLELCDPALPCILERPNP